MLKEAVESVLNQTHEDLSCIIYDDGSDSFDVVEFVKQWDDPRVVLALGDKMAPEERIRKGNTQWSTNMNYIMSKLPRDEWVLHLCDDDILALDWFDAVNTRVEYNDSQHIILGDLGYFQDGEDPYTQGRRGFPSIDANPDAAPGETMWWSLGAFAHSMECFWGEGVRWRNGLKDNTHSWDIQYCEALQFNHFAHVFVPQIALWRREHPNTMSAKLGRINEDGLYFKAGDEITLDAITTPME